MIKESYYLGKDLIYIPQQLMELVHNLSKDKIGIAPSNIDYNLAELDQISSLSSKVSIEALTIIWQMILKFMQELQLTNNQLIALEMLMIRLCHLSNIPTPSDLIKKLKQNINAKKANIVSESSNHKKAINNFEELVQLFYTEREMLLYHYLQNDVHLIEFSPLKLRIRQTHNVPHNFSNKIASLLYEWTGDKWLITVSSDDGSPTLSSQEELAKISEIDQLSQNDLVQEVLQNFSTAKVKDIVREA